MTKSPDGGVDGQAVAAQMPWMTREAMDLARALGDKACRVCTQVPKQNVKTRFCAGCKKDVNNAYNMFKEDENLDKCKELLTGNDDDFREVVWDCRQRLWVDGQHRGQGRRTMKWDSVRYAEVKETATQIQ